MEAVIKKWGNSPALRLSSSLMKTAELTMEQKVTVRARRGRIVIEPVKQVQYSLEELVSGINAGNLRGETDFGRPVGKEKEWL